MSAEDDLDDVSKSRAWRLQTLAVCIVLLVLQSLWLIGTTTLTDLGRLEKELVDVRNESARLTALAGTNAANSSSSASNVLEPLNTRRTELLPKIDAAVDGLTVWNKTWSWILDIFNTQQDNDEFLANATREHRSAKSATQILGLYILPLFYGWLGALLWVLRKYHTREIDGPVAELRPGTRVVTGMVAGPLIGMFINPEVLSSLASQAAPFALAFLGGYSSDLFFSIIDTLLLRARQMVSKPPEGEAADKPGQPDPAAQEPPPQEPKRPAKPRQDAQPQPATPASSTPDAATQPRESPPPTGPQQDVTRQPAA